MAERGSAADTLAGERGPAAVTPSSEWGPAITGAATAHQEQAAAAAATAGWEAAIPVRLHSAITVPASLLATDLGPGFDVRVADTCSEGVFVVPGHVFEEQAGEWAGQPQTAMLVLVAAGTSSREIAHVLDRGADGCLASSNSQLVASQVLALARRVLHRFPRQR